MPPFSHVCVPILFACTPFACVSPLFAHPYPPFAHGPPFFAGATPLFTLAFLCVCAPCICACAAPFHVSTPFPHACTPFLHTNPLCLHWWRGAASTGTWVCVGCGQANRWRLLRNQHVVVHWLWVLMSCVVWLQVAVLFEHSMTIVRSLMGCNMRPALCKTLWDKSPNLSRRSVDITHKTFCFQ